MTLQRRDRSSVPVLIIAATVVGCAGNPPGTTRQPEPTTPSVQFSEALEARARGDVESTESSLRAVWKRCFGQPLGDQAFLLLVATQLDPRFRDGSPDKAAATAADYLSSRSARSRWVNAMAESLHLLARNLGGSLGDEADTPLREPLTAEVSCGAVWQPVRDTGRTVTTLPVLPGPSLRSRLRGLQGTVDSLQAEVERLRKLLKTSSPR